MPLSPRTKKLIGTVIILAWIVLYSLLAMYVGVLLSATANGLEKFLYYAVAGTVWIVPIGLMFPWMHREPKKRR